MNSSRAVLWDMDGTLVDSEQYHWISWREALRAEGITITHDQFLSAFGQRNDSIITQWLGAPSPQLIEKIGEAKEEIYRTLVREQGIEPLPGVAKWVRQLLEEGWLQAIATAAPRKNVEVVLEALSATHSFQAIVSAEDVERGKPDPEVYLKAAARLGVLPAQCIVVEDAVAGVEGARSAGMHSIGVSRTGKHLQADVVVQSLDQLDSDAFDTLLQSGRLDPEDNECATSA
jgi:HAD superfamily hydrolase (TIGR01509 family)